MRKYKNVLVIIEPELERQIALERAISISKFCPDVKITAFLAIYDFSLEVNSVMSLAQQQEIKNNIVEKNKEWLENVFKDLQTQYPNIHSKVIWHRSLAKAILKEAEIGGYDLILKTNSDEGVEQNFISSLLFTPLDRQLLRNSNIPLIIAKEHNWAENSNILVAINFDDNEAQSQRLMNIKLLRNAQELATIIKGNIHLINAAIPIIPTAITEVPGFTPEMYSAAVEKQNQEKMELFANKHKIPLKNCHIESGHPDIVIPKLAKVLDAEAVIIGNFAHSSFDVAMLGNTCEEVLDQINCDLLVIKGN
ncbi:MAG: universal stress protein UspE [Succinivibrionaceae bacterium]